MGNTLAIKKRTKKSQSCYRMPSITSMSHTNNDREATPGPQSPKTVTFIAKFEESKTINNHAIQPKSLAHGTKNRKSRNKQN